MRLAAANVQGVAGFEAEDFWAGTGRTEGLVAPATVADVAGTLSCGAWRVARAGRLAPSGWVGENFDGLDVGGVASEIDKGPSAAGAGLWAVFTALDFFTCLSF